uniref:Large ribosomal subunit protein uL10m n=1 Tax=Salmo trutta TaxID=8032 RepID=A0A673Y644_SALTR
MLWSTSLCPRLYRWLPLMQSVQHGSKGVTRHKKSMHILKQKLMTVTEYIPPKPAAPPGILTPPRQTKGTVFQDCKVIAVIQNNATNSEDILLLKHRSYLPDSPYINMGPLFIGQTVIFVSKEPKVKQMFLSLRTSPQVVLLGKYNLMVLLPAVVSDPGLGRAGERPDHDDPQTASMLQRHPTHLSLLLQQESKCTNLLG